MAESSDWVILTEVLDETEAEIIKGLLESNGIPAKSEESDPYAGAMRVIGGLAYDISIFVPANCLKQARELLRSLPSE